MEKKSTLVTCSMIAGALLSVSAVKANTSLLNYNALGTASEVRTAIVKTIELNCGEKKGDAKAADTKTSDKKAKDGKCGEGKCGEKKDGKGKAKDGKCGEGKCGEKKDGHKADKPK